MRKLVPCLIGLVMAFGLIVMVNGCIHNDYAQVQPAVVQQPMLAQQPVIVAQPPVVIAAPSHDGFFTGYLMGHLMSGGHYGYGYHAPVQHSTTIVQNVTRNVTVNRPVIAAPRANTYVYRPSSSYRASSSYRSSSSYRRR
ncbi:hypothetical protein AB6809_29740 [Paraburkholderia sp. RCC_158]|uniref:hypothetical protein n=1 Tax=Paraburkholderia sp. RCC_158 TaxID=3239220 RepID=UPI0035249758